SEAGDECACSAGAVNEPCRCRRTKYRRVEFPVAVVVARCRYVSKRSEWEREEREIFASHHEPCAVGRPPDCDVRFAITCVIARNRLVSLDAKHACKGPCGRTLYPPFHVARVAPNDRNVCLAVAVVIGSNRLITGLSEHTD